MSYDHHEIEAQVVDTESEFFWIRLHDTLIDELKDIPVEGQSIIGFWTHGPGRCDCVRHRAFYQPHDLEGGIPCSETRFVLLGIWTPGGEQIYPLAHLLAPK